MSFIKYLKLLALAVFIVNITVAADEFNGLINLEHVDLQKITGNGSAKFRYSKFESIDVNGELDIKDTVVADSIKINGDMEASNVTCKNLIVSGSLESNNILVNKDTMINGYLKAKNSNFEDINATSEKIMLFNTRVNNIIVKSIKDKKTQQIILNGNTTINGNIIFESGIGEVLLLSKEVKIVGKVNGGAVKNHFVRHH